VLRKTFLIRGLVLRNQQEGHGFFLNPPYLNPAENLLPAMYVSEPSREISNTVSVPRKRGASLPAVSALQQQKTAVGINEPAIPDVKNQLPLQRKVKVEGKELKAQDTVGDEAYEEGSMGKGEDDCEQAIIDALMGNGAEFTFPSRGAWVLEIKMRKALIEGMGMLNQEDSPYHYNWNSHDLRLPVDTWRSIQYKHSGSQKEQSQSAFAPADKVSASKAITALFNKIGNSDEKFYLDCSSAILATHYRALLQGMKAIDIEDNEFDRQYSDMTITPQGVDAINHPKKGIMEPPGDKLTVEISVDSLDNLIPGDSVYFASFKDYDNTHEGPAAAWAGEHAVYCGNNKYQGFGAPLATYEEMLSLLTDRYNKQGTNSKHKTKKDPENADDTMSGKRPGILRKVTRLKRPAV
jgi:hypothetical protein